MRRVIGNLTSVAFGGIDGVVKNADLAAGRTQALKQRAAWVEGGALLVGLLLVAMGDSPVGEGLLYGAESVVMERGGMWAGLQLTRQGPGRLEMMPQLIDTTMVPMGGDGHFLGPNPMPGGFGAHLTSAIYPAQREPAGILG